MALVLGTFFLATHLGRGAPPPVAALPSGVALLQVSAYEDPTAEEQLRGWTREAYRGIRRSVRQSYRLLSRSAQMWGRWLKRAVFSFLTVLVFLLADRSLLAAWRQQGLSALRGSAPLMLYVYLRLLLTPRVAVLAKLFLLLAIVYGVKRSELIPDRGFLSGKVDDVLLLGLATRAFVRACPQELVNRYAADAVAWRRRMQASRRPLRTPIQPRRRPPGPIQPRPRPAAPGARAMRGQRRR